jgi:hypothetical protein
MYIFRAPGSFGYNASWLWSMHTGFLLLHVSYRIITCFLFSLSISGGDGNQVLEEEHSGAADAMGPILNLSEFSRFVRFVNEEFAGCST